jgi:hypothetical protein
MQSVGAVTACQLLIGNASVVVGASVVGATVSATVEVVVAATVVSGATVVAIASADVAAAVDEEVESSEHPAMANPNIAMTTAVARLTSTSLRRWKHA